MHCSWTPIKIFEVWVMNADGCEKTSWTKLFQIRSSGLLNILGFSRNGKAVRKNKNGHLLLYEPTTLRLEIMNFWWYASDFMIRGQVTNYIVESLVSVHGGNQLSEEGGSRSQIYVPGLTYTSVMKKMTSLMIKINKLILP